MRRGAALPAAHRTSVEALCSGELLLNRVSMLAALCRRSALLLCVQGLLPLGWGQARAAQAASTAAERRVEQRLAEAAVKPPQLRALLGRMPKGADLHMHLSGAVYAETLLEDAREDGLCVDLAGQRLVGNSGATGAAGKAASCPAPTVPVAQAFADQTLYDELIDAFSMRTFVPVSGTSGHDHFFATFDRYDPTHSAGERHGGEWLDEVATRAAAQNEQYLEIMHTPDLTGVFAAARALKWPEQPQVRGDYGQDVTGTSDEQLAALRTQLLRDAGFQATVARDRAEFAELLAQRRAREHCGEGSSARGCEVEIRFLFQVLRALPKAEVFVQTLLAFEVAEQERARGAEATVVGLNFVQPEDGRVAMAEYTRQMRTIGYLHGLYPQVNISLHAGELGEGMVRPEGLRFHIRQAVEIAHAERIGHGVDVMFEDDPNGLLREMATRHVLEEVNLTSNDVILNVKGADHPLAEYLAAHVPVALSTDDEGVSRIDLTHEYGRAATEQHVGYRELKQMARASLEHSFLPGRSLWQAPDDFGRPVPECAVAGIPSGGCAALLAASLRARQQWELERRLREFEGSVR